MTEVVIRKWRDFKEWIDDADTRVYRIDASVTRPHLVLQVYSLINSIIATHYEPVWDMEDGFRLFGVKVEEPDFKSENPGENDRHRYMWWMDTLEKALEKIIDMGFVEGFFKNGVE